MFGAVSARWRHTLLLSLSRRGRARHLPVVKWNRETRAPDPHLLSLYTLCMPLSSTDRQVERRMHARARARTHTHILMRAHTRARVHTHTQTNTRARAHRHTHTHTYSPPSCAGPLGQSSADDGSLGVNLKPSLRLKTVHSQSVICSVTLKPSLRLKTVHSFSVFSCVNLKPSLRLKTVLSLCSPV